MAAQESVREVTASDDSLLEEIEAGRVPRPALLGFNDWVSWRAGEGRRPAIKHGDPRSTTPGEEAALWRAVMQALYGESWREDLAEARDAAEIAQADEAEEAGSATAGAERGLVLARASGPPTQSVLGGAEPEQPALGGSGTATPTGLKQVLEQEYDPEKEDREAWQARVLRAAMQMERLGQPVSEYDLEKIVRKGGYCEAVRGMTLAGQTAWLKTELGNVLLTDGHSELEYNARLGALMEMLRARGAQVSSSAGKLFSSDQTATGSAEVSPQKVRPAPQTPPSRQGRRAPEDDSPSKVAEDALAQAIRLQTETLAQVLRDEEGQKHTVVKVLSLIHI